jgi:hypothetical protein
MFFTTELNIGKVKLYPVNLAFSLPRLKPI